MLSATEWLLPRNVLQLGEVHALNAVGITIDLDLRKIIKIFLDAFQIFSLTLGHTYNKVICLLIDMALSPVQSMVFTSLILGPAEPSKTINFFTVNSWESVCQTAEQKINNTEI